MRIASDQRSLLGVAAVGFIASAAVTVLWCDTMASLPGMQMPGGWTMSMAWMRMPGQGWPGAAATFLGMWAVMMIAMMLPALVPMLSSYRRSLSDGSRARIDTLTLRVATGYFLAWTAAGLVAYPLGVALAELAMRVPAVSRGVPLAASLVTLLAGAAQLSRWKARQLACCRETVDCRRPPAGTAPAAWRHGFDLGGRCLRCCAPLTALLFVMGVMDLRAMALVALAISLERLAPRGVWIARLSGGVIVLSGLLLARHMIN